MPDIDRGFARNVQEIKDFDRGFVRNLKKIKDVVRGFAWNLKKINDLRALGHGLPYLALSLSRF